MLAAKATAPNLFSGLSNLLGDLIGHGFDCSKFGKLMTHIILDSGDSQKLKGHPAGGLCERRNGDSGAAARESLFADERE